MTESVAQPVPGLFSRAIAVVVSPRSMFEKMLPTPRVIGALLLCGLAIGISRGGPLFTATGKQAALDAQVKQTEQFTGRAVTDEQYAQMQRFAPVQAITTLIFAPVGVAIFSLIIAGIYFVIFNVILGGTATFKQVMAVVAHAALIDAMGQILGAVVQYFQGVLTQTGPFTLGALMPFLDEKTFLARLLSFVTVFGLWTAVTVAIGFSVLYKRKTSSIIIWPLALMLGFAALAAAVIGAFTRG